MSLVVHSSHEMMRVPSDGADAAKRPHELRVLLSRRFLKLLVWDGQRVMFSRSATVRTHDTGPRERAVLALWVVGYSEANEAVGAIGAGEQQLMRRDAAADSIVGEEHIAECVLRGR